MNKVLLTCGAGASSGFLAQRTRQALAKMNVEMEVKAVSESELNEYINDYDILMVGPHLRYKLDEIKKIAESSHIEVRLIDEEIYGSIDGEALAKQMIEFFNEKQKDKSSPIEVKKEEEVAEKKQNESKNKMMSWVENSFAPKMNKIANNPFIKGIQDSMMTVLPFIMVGSLISIWNIVREYIPALPDLTLISSFSFGLFSLFLAFLIPFRIMENYKITKFKYYAALSGVSSYMLLMMPTLDDAGNIIYIFEKMGAGGMLVSLVVSVFVSWVMLIFSKFSFFKKDTTMPDIVVSWTDAMLPIFIILLVSMLFFTNGIDVYAGIQALFDPIVGFSQSLAGIVICSMVVSVLYSFGISSWVVFPVIWAIWMQGMANNQALVAAGQAATNLNLMEFFHPFVYLGGTGATLALAFFMYRSKSKRLNAMGKFTIIPSILNINEPVVFGTPIAFNLILMIPMWLVSLILPITTYAAFKIGLVNIPSTPFQVWYLPVFFYGYLATGDVRAFILIIVNLLISAIIYYPFFKVYERQELQKEALED